eukprot:357808-Chlamydomonas_euryale.AAC.5
MSCANKRAEGFGRAGRSRVVDGCTTLGRRCQPHADASRMNRSCAVCADPCRRRRVRHARICLCTARQGQCPDGFASHLAAPGSSLHENCMLLRAGGVQMALQATLLHQDLAGMKTACCCGNVIVQMAFQADPLHQDPARM